MLLFIFVIVITVVFTFLAWQSDGDICGFTSIMLWFVVIAMAFFMILENGASAGHLASCQQKREILQYQVDNNLYTNYIDNGKESLYQKVMDYNQMVASGKELIDNVWIGAFYGDYYKDLELVELP